MLQVFLLYSVDSGHVLFLTEGIYTSQQGRYTLPIIHRSTAKKRQRSNQYLATFYCIKYLRKMLVVHNTYCQGQYLCDLFSYCI